MRTCALHLFAGILLIASACGHSGKGGIAEAATEPGETTWGESGTAGVSKQRPLNREEALEVHQQRVREKVEHRQREAAARQGIADAQADAEVEAALERGRDRRNREHEARIRESIQKRPGEKSADSQADAEVEAALERARDRRNREHEARIQEIVQQRRAEARADAQAVAEVGADDQGDGERRDQEREARIYELILQLGDAIGRENAAKLAESMNDKPDWIRAPVEYELEHIRRTRPGVSPLWLELLRGFDPQSEPITVAFDKAQLSIVLPVLASQTGVRINCKEERSLSVSAIGQDEPLESMLSQICISLYRTEGVEYCWVFDGRHYQIIRYEQFHDPLEYLLLGHQGGELAAGRGSPPKLILWGEAVELEEGKRFELQTRAANSLGYRVTDIDEDAGTVTLRAESPEIELKLTP